MSHRLPHRQVGADAGAAQRAMHQHRVGQEQVARPGGQQGRREALAEVAVERREVGILQVVAVRIEGDRVRQPAEDAVDAVVGLEAVAGLR